MPTDPPASPASREPSEKAMAAASEWYPRYFPECLRKQLARIIAKHFAVPADAPPSPSPDPGAIGEHDDDEEPLKPCPFCGSEANYGDSPDGGRFIECTNARCRASSKLMFPEKGDTDPLLAECWNTRRLPDPDAEVRQLRDELEWYGDQKNYGSRLQVLDDKGKRARDVLYPQAAGEKGEAKP